MFKSDFNDVVFNYIEEESSRQKWGLEMIASENYVSEAVMKAQGSILTNKYAEGYPQKRYYGGCQVVDKIESLAISRAEELFSTTESRAFANVQPHSGSQANMAVYLSALNAGDSILGMDLSHGGHLTHGSPVNFSGILFKAHGYKLDPETEKLNYNLIQKQAEEIKPKMIIAGYSAYSQKLDFKKFREIADSVGATLLVDMAHFAGLVASGHHESPLNYADYVTSTTHKTLRGPRGGIILTAKEENLKKMNSKIFPGIQGGPLEHVIAAKAVAFGEALKPEFKSYIHQVILNAKCLAAELQSLGFYVVSGGTENHLVLIDLKKSDVSDEVTGKLAENILDQSGITVNKNTVPHETRSPFVTSGIRLGTPALTTRGFKESEMKKIANWISQTLKNQSDEKLRHNIHMEVKELCQKFPIY